MWSFLAGEDAVCPVSDSECEENLKKLQDGMMKAFDYSEGMAVWTYMYGCIWEGRALS